MEQVLGEEGWQAVAVILFLSHLGPQVVMEEGTCVALLRLHDIVCADGCCLQASAVYVGPPNCTGPLEGPCRDELVRQLNQRLDDTA